MLGEGNKEEGEMFTRGGMSQLKSITTLSEAPSKNGRGVIGIPR